MMDSFSRRRLLQAGGIGTALAMAGCSSLNEPGGGDGNGANGEVVVTVAANVDDEAMAEIQETLQGEQERIQEELEAGEIDEEEAEEQLQEAQMEAQEAQQELIAAAVEDVEGHVGGTEGLAVADTAPGAGVLLVEGGAEAIVALLDLAEVGGLFAAAQFEQFREGS